jgi:uncharacterized cupin superfamily protein
MNVFNLFDGAAEPLDGMPAGFHQRAAVLGERLGGSRIGASVCDLAPGERTWPYHFELDEEEWLLVVSGEPTLREPGGERRLRAGDVVCFPPGPDGAHQVRNDTRELARVVLWSAAAGGVGSTVYPDSGKAQVRGPETLFRWRTGPVLDYWDGEL